ncbi:MAG TPA: hypothetical protein VI248_07270 [Kineosporiaceae bacterium]
MTDPEGPGDAQPQGERDDRPELDIDSAFAAIVAGFADPVPHGVGPWPAAEDLDDAEPPGPPGAAAPTHPEEGPAAGAAPGTERWDPPLRRISLPGEGTDGDVASSPAGPPAGEDGEEEGYVPPEPPPFPRGDLVARLAWAGVIGGPVFLLLAALLWRSLPTILLLLALTAFVGGFVTLVARMPQENPDDPDDGAVV